MSNQQIVIGGPAVTLNQDVTTRRNGTLQSNSIAVVDSNNNVIASGPITQGDANPQTVVAGNYSIAGIFQTGTSNDSAATISVTESSSGTAGTNLAVIVNTYQNGTSQGSYTFDSVAALSAPRNLTTSVIY